MTNIVYQIKNLKTEKIYIGSSNNERERWLRHLNDLRNSKHHCIFLQRAYTKYGEENFEFSVLYRFNTIKEAREKEQEILESYFSLDEKNRLEKIYNLSKQAGGGDLVSYHPLNLEIRNKISMGLKKRYSEMSDLDKIAYSKKYLGDKNPNWRGGISSYESLHDKCECGKDKEITSTLCKDCHCSSRFGERNPFYGKRHTDEFKNKMSAYRKELYKNMRENGILHCNATQVIVDYKVFDSILDASKHLKITHGAVKNRLEQNKSFSYLDFNQPYHGYFYCSSLSKDEIEFIVSNQPFKKIVDFKKTVGTIIYDGIVYKDRKSLCDSLGIKLRTLSYQLSKKRKDCYDLKKITSEDVFIDIVSKYGYTI